MRIGYVGLGKMGLNQVIRLREKGHEVVAWNRSDGPRKEAERYGAEIVSTLKDLVLKLETPRTIWLMLPHSIIEETIEEILPHLKGGDTIIDGANSLYTESMRRSEELAKKKINFLDVGVSGGPSGARHGACLMIGGEHEEFKKHVPLFKDLSRLGGFLYVGKAGAGHFVKMVHNGIEYGMMQAIGEGFEVLRKSEFDLNLDEISALYNVGSVIESRLVAWLADAYKKHGKDLKGISGEIAHSGEGEWTVEAAKKLGVPTPIIEGSFKFRVNSKGKPSYTGKVVSALRNEFGGHDVTDKK